MRILRQLCELIAAIDRRVPQPGRIGEFAIASDAAALRKEALMTLSGSFGSNEKRLRAMEHHSTDEDRRRAFLTYLLLESDDETHELVTQVGHDAARHAADDAIVLACRENGTTTADLIVGRFKHRLQELLAASRRTH